MVSGGGSSKSLDDAWSPGIYLRGRQPPVHVDQKRYASACDPAAQGGADTPLPTTEERGTGDHRWSRHLYAATASVGSKLIPFDAGINPMAAIATPDGPRRPAILIASSPHKSGLALTPWEDVFAPDDGYVRYFGDAKTPGATASAAPGNALLTAEFERHHGAKSKGGVFAPHRWCFSAASPTPASRRAIQDFRGLASSRLFVSSPSTATP